MICDVIKQCVRPHHADVLSSRASSMVMHNQRMSIWTKVLLNPLLLIFVIRQTFPWVVRDCVFTRENSTILIEKLYALGQTRDGGDSRGVQVHYCVDVGSTCSVRTEENSCFGFRRRIGSILMTFVDRFMDDVGCNIVASVF